MRIAIASSLSIAVFLGGCQRAAAPPPSPPAPAPTVAPAGPATTPVPPPKDPKDAKREQLKISLEQARETQARLSQALAALGAGQTATALELLDDVLALSPGNLQASLEKCRTLRDLGRHDEALAALDDALKATPDGVALLEERARTQLAKGDRPAAMLTVEQALKQNLPLPGMRFLKATIAAAAGDRETALAALEDAAKSGFLGWRQIELDPHLQPLAGEPRLRAIVATIKGQIEESHRRAAQTLAAEGESKPLPEAQPLDPREEIGILRQNIARKQGEELSLELLDLDGKALRVGGDVGKLLVVLAWGPWSEGSRQILPELRRIRDEYRDKDVEVATVAFEPAAAPPGSMEEAARSVRGYLQAQQLDLRCAMIEEEAALQYLRVGGYPTVLFFGRDGKCYLRTPGFKEHRVLKEAVDILLGAM